MIKLFCEDNRHFIFCPPPSQHNFSSKWHQQLKTMHQCDRSSMLSNHIIVALFFIPHSTCTDQLHTSFIQVKSCPVGCDFPIYVPVCNMNIYHTFMIPVFCIIFSLVWLEVRETTYHMPLSCNLIIAVSMVSQILDWPILHMLSVTFFLMY